MGKRRERRMAAKSSSGRRVKLDLFAEPSGDLGGSSAKDELEGGLDSKRSGGLPNSPSSSGQQPENPLLLLGQYSDDEEENQSSSSRDHANGDTSLGNHTDQVEAPPPPVNEREELDVCMDVEEVQKFEKDAVQDSHSPKDFQKVDVGDSRDGDIGISADPRKEIDAGEQNTVGGTSDAQVVGDVSSGWKMVLHEESNRYYYWNVETGETSWEVPEALAPLTEASSDGTYATSAGEKIGGLPLDTRDLNSSSTFIVGGEVAAGFEYYATSNGHLVAQSHSLGEVGTPGDGLTEGLEGTVPRDLPDSGDVSRGFEVGMQDSVICGTHDSGIDHWSHLIKLGDSLLQKLNLLRSSVHLPPDHDWIPKCVLEVEIRLSDMKLLSSYGSSLNPFWVHSEGRLRQLESFIDNSKVGQASDSKLNGDTKETHLFGATEDSGSHRSVKDESETSHLKNEVPSDELTHSYPGMVTLTEAAAGVPCEDVPVTNGLNVYSEEDMDMDVDMEVEDATSKGHDTTVEMLGGETFAASDNSAKQDELAEPPIPGPGDGSPIPPPPDEEWIPPPPPDPEQIPPPPDEPEPSYPLPPPTEVGQPLPYADPYSLSYPNSSYGIYGHSDVTGTNFYGHAEAQVMVPQVPLPYGAVFSTYADPVSVANNVEPVAYYNIQDASGPSIGVAAVGSTQFQIQSAPLSFSSLSTDQVGAGHGSLLSHPSVEPPEARGSTADGFSGVTSTSAPTSSATVEAPATTLVRESVSDPSADAIAAATTATASADAKVPKALRTKKRTVATAISLRSNKKVSSLVDKWKAAKEELEEEEEDEAKTALAMLEKKRQREIEEWRAQQIASGEAKENANFQPLGGDWRERVKRKRAQAKKEAASTTEEPPKGNQQPVSGDLSKDLPSGWQAYWDESSKQFYYGNTLTSETSWIRPTK